MNLSIMVKGRKGSVGSYRLHIGDRIYPFEIRTGINKILSDYECSNPAEFKPDPLKNLEFIKNWKAVEISDALKESPWNPLRLRGLDGAEIVACLG